MTRIFVLFNLKPGVEKATYEAWAKATDIPIVRDLPSIAGFDAYACTSLLGSDAKPPYDYVEVVDVKDMDQFGKDVATATMQRVAAEFQALADPLFILSRKVDG
jgi:hypothetical protein